MSRRDALNYRDALSYRRNIVASRRSFETRQSYDRLTRGLVVSEPDQLADIHPGAHGDIAYVTNGMTYWKFVGPVLEDTLCYSLRSSPCQLHPECAGDIELATACALSQRRGLLPGMNVALALGAGVVTKEQLARELVETPSRWKPDDSPLGKAWAEAEAQGLGAFVDVRPLSGRWVRAERLRSQPWDRMRKPDGND